MNKKLELLNTLPFIACLLLLLLNDFYLKEFYHNWLTGKLSDFCGLFVFVSFWAALLPKYKRYVYFSTALLFILWKSPYAQGFIDFFSQNVFAIHRVVDVSDLLALFVLPVAYLYRPINFIPLKINPLLIALLTIFSFGATSMPPDYQKFEQPQYLLFKPGDQDFGKRMSWNSYEVHKLDSLIIIEIEEMELHESSPIKDEFYKAQILKDLDLRFLRELHGGPFDELTDFEMLRDTQIVSQPTSITLNLPTYKDTLNFKDGRLAGAFKRLTINNQVLISGQYEAGIEDSLWTFYNEQNEIIRKKNFSKGELVKTERFNNGKLIGEEFFNTREELIQYKYFHIAIIGLVMIAIIARLFLIYRKSKPEDIIKWPTYANILTSISLPIVVLLIGRMISAIIPNSNPSMFPDVFIEIIMLYIILVPLSLIVFFGFKLWSEFDLLFYILLFSLGLVFWEEWRYLEHLML